MKVSKYTYRVISKVLTMLNSTKGFWRGENYECKHNKRTVAVKLYACTSLYVTLLTSTYSINDHEPALVILLNDFEGNANTHVQENLIRPYGSTWTLFRDSGER